MHLAVCTSLTLHFYDQLNLPGFPFTLKEQDSQHVFSWQTWKPSEMSQGLSGQFLQPASRSALQTHLPLPKRASGKTTGSPSLRAESGTEV